MTLDTSGRVLLQKCDDYQLARRINLDDLAKYRTDTVNLEVSKVENGYIIKYQGKTVVIEQQEEGGETENRIGHEIVAMLRGKV